MNRKMPISWLAVLPLALMFGGNVFAGDARTGLFVSLSQDPPVLSSPSQITRLLEFAQQAHIETLFVQIYQSNKAFFPSRIADDSSYEENLKKVGKDTFQELIDQAHQHHIQVHAWINVLSLGNNRDASFLKKYGSEILTRNPAPKGTLEDYKIDGQYFLEPGDLRVRKDLAGIVGEIVKAYPRLDGLQFDYIRYPDLHPHYGFTALNIKRFQEATGIKNIDENSHVWQEWKRRQVTELLSLLIKTAKALHPGIQVSTTGCMPYSRAYLEAFQDWPLWVSTGLVDFVTIMDYSPNPSQFTQWIKDVRGKTKDFSKVRIAIGAYRFLNAPALFEEEFRTCKPHNGCVVFHYGSICQSPAIKQFLILSSSSLKS